MTGERTHESRADFRRRLDETMKSVEHAIASFERVQRTVNELRGVVSGCTVKRCVTVEEAHRMESMIEELTETLKMTA